VFWLLEQKMARVKRIIPMQAIKAYARVELQHLTFLTSVLVGGE
jgi:hypothetical protein